ncbi:MAG: dihydrofolate reductase family protein [Reinekea sp.]
MKASAFVTTTLDGYLARPDHRLDWLEEANSDSKEDYGYDAFINQITTVVMGRKTFEKIMTLPEWPYKNQRLILLSSIIKQVPDELEDQIQLFNGDVVELTNLLDAEGEEHLYVDGSQAIQAFINAGLMTDLTITTLPILIGEGVPLFGGPLNKDIRLKHQFTKAYKNGFVQTSYRF